MPAQTLFGRITGRIHDVVVLLADKGRAPILISVAIGWLLILGTRILLPTLLPYIKDAFTFGNTIAGFLITGLWGAYALTQFPAGILTDRIGERKTLVVSVLVAVAGVSTLVAAPTFIVFVIGTILFGFGSGLYAPPRVTVLSRIYPDHDSTVLGVTFAIGNIGSALLPLVASGLVLLFGWQFGFVFVIPPLLLVGIALWVFVPLNSDGSARVIVNEPRRVVQRLADEMTHRNVVVIWLAMTLMLVAYQGLIAFLPTYLIANKGINQPTAAALFGLFFASGAVSQFVSGTFADRYNERRVLATIAAFSVVSLVALPFIDGIVALSTIVILLGTRLGVSPVSNGYVAAILSDDVQGSGYGLFRTVYIAVGSLGSSLVGVLADMGLFSEAFFVLAGITSVAAGLYLLLPASSRGVSTASSTARSSPSSAVEPGSDAGEESDNSKD
jgi:predicted MFS family arabinose efflux permease